MKKRLFLSTLFFGLFSLILWGQNKVTVLHNPKQQLPITLGLQYQSEVVWGLRLGTDYIYAQKDKPRIPKNENRQERLNQTTRHLGLNFQIAHAESSFNNYILQAEHFVRKTKASGLVLQLGYGVGFQRSQYIGLKEENSISGRSYWVGTLQAGVGYELSKIGAKGSVLAQVKRDFLTQEFKGRGVNNVLELTYRLPLFNL